MEDVIKVFENDNYKLVIDYDTDPIDPRRDIENCLGIMITKKNRDYTLGDYRADNIIRAVGSYLELPETHCYCNTSTGESFEELKSLEDIMTGIHRVAYILPIYMYNHSNIILTTEKSDLEYAKWDKSYIGAIFCLKDKAVEYFGDIEEIEERVMDFLKSEIEVYSQYLNGSVTCYVLYSKSTCKECKYIHYEEVDSCYNFYGTDYMTNGILDHIDISYDELNDLISQ